MLYKSIYFMYMVGVKVHMLTAEIAVKTMLTVDLGC